MKKVSIHPITKKLASQGHPWIIKDSYTDKFPKDQLLMAVDESKKDLFCFINDSEHPKIKGRIWSTTAEAHFEETLKSRIQNSISKRESISDREIKYLVFGEADQLPGLFVMNVNHHVFIQMRASFWNQYIDIIKQCFEGKTIFIQNRKNKSQPWQSEKSIDAIRFQEFGVNYLIDPSDPDLGFYADMSSIRKKIKPFIEGKSAVANLFSYTGAFSLYALSLGVQNVSSIDLSKEYLNRLDENIKLNNFKGTHNSIKSDVMKWLNKSDSYYDVIICDPPSSSTDGKRRRNNLKLYEEMLPEIYNKSQYAIIFLNTHSINMNKFKNKINSIIKENSLKYKIIQELKLGEDCPTIKGFPEGNYLKGLVLKKH